MREVTVDKGLCRITLKMQVFKGNYLFSLHLILFYLNFEKIQFNFSFIDKTKQILLNPYYDKLLML